MGYETELLIGRSIEMSMPECKRSEVGEIDGDYIHYPYLKKNGKEIKTGREQHDFIVDARIRLSKVGYDGALSKLDNKNAKESKADKKNVHKWYEGNVEFEEDSYGAKRNPIPINDVIKALEKNNAEIEKEEGSTYRRLDWALALLKSIRDSAGRKGKEFSVILLGY